MGFKHHRSRRDSNHDEIAETYRQLLCSVHDTSMVGFGFPDLAVGAGMQTDLVEIKTEDGDLDPRQKTFHRDWRGAKPVVVRTKEDVIEHVQRLRKAIARN